MIAYGLNKQGAPVLLEATTEAIDDLLERVRVLLLDPDNAEAARARVLASAERLYWTQRCDLEELEEGER